MILSCYVALVYRKLSSKSSFFEKAMFPVSEEQRKERKNLIPEAVRRAYMVMHEAICTHQSVVFKKAFHRAGAQSAKAVYFMPKRILYEGGKFFAVGYHHAGERIETVDLHEIAEIQLVQLHSPKTAKKAEQILSEYRA